MPEHIRDDVLEVCVSTITVKTTSTMTESQPRETGCMEGAETAEATILPLGTLEIL